MKLGHNCKFQKFLLPSAALIFTILKWVSCESSCCNVIFFCLCFIAWLVNRDTLCLQFKSYWSSLLDELHRHKLSISQNILKRCDHYFFDLAFARVYHPQTRQKNYPIKIFMSCYLVSRWQCVSQLNKREWFDKRLFFPSIFVRGFNLIWCGMLYYLSS